MEIQYSSGEPKEDECGNLKMEEEEIHCFVLATISNDDVGDLNSL